MPELVVARVDDELLAGLGVLDDDQTRVGELVLPGVDEPDRDDLVPLAQPQQGPLPPGRGDEVGDEDDERIAGGSCGPPSRAAAVRSVTAPLVSGGGRRRLRASASTWLRL